jgi:hypothetical protein
MSDPLGDLLFPTFQAVPQPTHAEVSSNLKATFFGSPRKHLSQTKQHKAHNGSCAAHGGGSCPNGSCTLFPELQKLTDLPFVTVGANGTKTRGAFGMTFITEPGQETTQIPMNPEDVMEMISQRMKSQGVTPTSVERRSRSKSRSPSPSRKSSPKRTASPKRAASPSRSNKRNSVPVSKQNDASMIRPTPPRTPSPSRSKSVSSRKASPSRSKSKK